MSYKKLVQEAVRMAFIALGDLKYTMLIQKIPVAPFEFGSAARNNQGNPVPAQLNLVAVTVKLKKSSPSRNLISKEVIVNAENLVDITPADKIQEGSVIWNVSEVFSSDGYLTYLSLYRNLT